MISQIILLKEIATFSVNAVVPLVYENLSTFGSDKNIFKIHTIFRCYCLTFWRRTLLFLQPLIFVKHLFQTLPQKSTCFLCQQHDSRSVTYSEVSFVSALVIFCYFSNCWWWKATVQRNNWNGHWLQRNFRFFCPWQRISQNCDHTFMLVLPTVTAF